MKKLHQAYKDHKEFCVMFLVFLILLLVNFVIRFPGLFDNVLYADDFLYFVDHSKTIISYDICRFPAQDFRWFSMGNICLTGTKFESFAVSVWPKVIGITALSLFALLMYKILVEWGLSVLGGLSLSLVFIVHPIVNEILLWNVTGQSPILFLFVLLAFYLSSSAESLAKSSFKLVGAGLLLFIVSLSYEYALTVFLVFALFSPLINQLNGRVILFNQTVKLVLIFVAASMFFVLQSKVFSMFFVEQLDSRGIDFTGFLSTSVEEKVAKLRALLNILANIYMTPLSFFVPIESAWTFWKYLPICIAVAIGISVFFLTRSLARATFYVCLFVGIQLLLIAPFFITSQTPESWRISIPSLLAVVVCLSFVYLALERVHVRTKNILPMLFFMPLICTMAFIANSEAHLRSKEYTAELILFKQIRDHWIEKDISLSEIRVGRIADTGYLENHLDHPAANLTVAFHKRGLYLGLAEEIAWRPKLVHFGFNVVELESHDSEFYGLYGKTCSDAYCDFELGARLKRKCMLTPQYESTEVGLRLAHDLDSRTTAVCL